MQTQLDSHFKAFEGLSALQQRHFALWHPDSHATMSAYHLQ